MKPGVIIRVIGLSTLIFVALGLILPKIRIEAYKEAIREQLQQKLHRNVSLGSPRLELFSGPGLRVDQVIIHEREGFGEEPFIYAETMFVKLSMASLLRRKIEISELVFEEASINLTFASNGQWNFEDLVRTSSSHANEEHLVNQRSIALVFEDSRFNLKHGQVKSPLYLLNSDLELFPSRAKPGYLQVRFRGEMARSDRRASGFGLVSFWGRWKPMDPQGDAEFELQLDRLQLGELTGFWAGSIPRLHGNASVHARLLQAAEQTRIFGELSVVGLHYWEIIGSERSVWSTTFHGYIKERGEELHFDGASELEVGQWHWNLRVADLLVDPKIHFQISCQNVPVERFLRLGKELGAPIHNPRGVSGVAYGVLTYTSHQALAGQLEVQDFTVRVSDRVWRGVVPATVTIRDTTVKIDDIRLATKPDPGKPSPDLHLGLEYDFSSRVLTVALSANGVTQADLESCLRGFNVDSQSVWPSWLAASSVHGQFQLTRTPRQELYRANFLLSDASFLSEARYAPFKFKRLRVASEPGRFQLEGNGALGATPVRLRVEKVRPRSWVCDLSVDQIGPEVGLQTRLSPSGAKQALDYLNDTIQLLRGLKSNVRGTIKVRKVSWPSLALSDLHLSYVFEQGELKLLGDTVFATGAKMRVWGTVDVGQKLTMALGGQLRGLNFLEGRAQADFIFRAQGFLRELLKNGRVDGSFRLSNAKRLFGEMPVALEGTFAANGLLGPKIQLDEVQVTARRLRASGSGWLSLTNPAVLELKLFDTERHRVYEGRWELVSVPNLRVEWDQELEKRKYARQ